MNLNSRIVLSLTLGLLFLFHGIAHAESRGMRQWYAAFKPKGSIRAGVRVTIMTGRKEYKVGESVEVIHVYEATEPGHDILGTLSKPVYGEFVDGKSVSKKKPGITGGGLVRTSPTTDFDYEITKYTFDKPGKHTIQWKPNVDWDKNSITSNTITLNISEK